jgi:ankyrin repeat protein
LRPDIQDKNGRSPLHLAAGEDKLDAIKYLLNNGGNPYLKGIRGINVIDEARREGRTDIVMYLRQRTEESNIHNFCHRFGEGLLEKGIQ